MPPSDSIPEDLERLRELAEVRSWASALGPGKDLILLIRQGLRSLSAPTQGGFPLKELAELLAPVAQTRGLSEEELMEGGGQGCPSRAL